MRTGNSFAEQGRQSCSRDWTALLSTLTCKSTTPLCLGVAGPMFVLFCVLVYLCIGVLVYLCLYVFVFVCVCLCLSVSVCVCLSLSVSGCWLARVPFTCCSSRTLVHNGLIHTGECLMH